MTSNETAIARPQALKETERSKILGAFRAEYPELAEAMQLAGEAEQVWHAFERGQENVVTYTTSSGTEMLR